MKIENLSMKTKKIIALMMAVALAISCLAACGGAPADEDAGGNDANAGTIKITDHADKEVEVPAEINRIAVCDIFPIPSVLAVFALNFNELFKEYDMSATFHSSFATTYAMVIKSMTETDARAYYNLNAAGRQCASTVMIMIVSGIILYLVYGVGSRDITERLEAKKRRKAFFEKLGFGKKAQPEGSAADD